MIIRGRTVRKAKHRNGEEFKAKVGIYQGLVPSLLLFFGVIEALTCTKPGRDSRESCYMPMIWRWWL